MIWVVGVLLLFIFQTATILIGEYKRPAKTVAWLFVLFILPIIGFLMYYFLAKEYTQRKTVRRKGRRRSSEPRYQWLGMGSHNQERIEEQHYQLFEDSRLCGLLHNIPGSAISPNNRVKVLTNADITYEAMLEAIERAEKHIHFEFYTIRHDAIGNRFQEALIRKALQGVKVRVIYDGIGSYSLSSAYINRFKQAGIEVYPFLRPLIAFFDKRMNYRNHRKIIVIDGLVGFVGGINIGDEYLGGDPKLGFWRDTHLMLHGDSVYYLQTTFMTDWLFVSGERLADDSMYPEHHESETSLVQVISSGPDAYWDAIQEMFFAGIVAAKKRVYMTTPYFIPDASITMALKTAVLSGVDVRIILPYKADSRIVQYASRSYLLELMQAGVQFYLYRKGFMHAKVMIIDHMMATVGTANVDMRSFFSNFELNAVMFNQDVIDRLEDDFWMDLKDSDELKLAEFEQRSRLEKGKEVIARLLSPLF
ncbi:cardiolipin synthase [Paenibacillus sp. CGMCC 1.16610]|uniref:Cardiolipin synthase n=1 Tax=Paenibacillus anseongense TaxID=2682845 RepID=A0ABW9U2G2_9BACL|nr:cardiolipin synthase [Paenibacillus sp. CGMCC 1.16610]MBA2943142.1 cardiolipin synthase [Paenibacillus sp. CGMCC 1.16610]MVQ33638.1 cardiolipin synthase [Paenibacillus anseongense]